VGNAVPPLLGYHLANKIREYINLDLSEKKNKSPENKLNFRTMGRYQKIF
jgi:hypothetical protein